MAQRNKPLSSKTIMLINVLVVGLFLGLLITGIMYFSKNSSRSQNATLKDSARTFASGVTNSHWLWRSNGKPKRVLLVHYNKEGKEFGRTPVMMSTIGWPDASANREGCITLWRSLMNSTLMVDGFRIFSEYYELGESDRYNSKAFCRYRLSSGSAFDYVPELGQVSYLGKD